MARPKSIVTKLLILLLCLLAGTLLGNGIMIGTLYITGIDGPSSASLSDLLSSTDSKPLVMALIGVSHFCLFVVSACLYWLMTREEGLTEYFHIRGHIRWDLLSLLVLLLLASYPLVGAAGLVTEYLPMPDWLISHDDVYADTIYAMLGGRGFSQLLLNIIVIALLPAIGEELIFRGIVQRELQLAMPNVHVTILITSIIFSAIHLQAEGFLPKLVISYILCYAYHWADNILYPMLLHFINNAGMTVALYMSSDMTDEMAQLPPQEFPWLGVAISLFLCAVIVRSIYQLPKVSRATIPNGEPN